MSGVMLSSLQPRDTSEGGHEASMQFTTPIQQLTTCPQCDNVVRVDAEFCNICGKRLRPSMGPDRLASLQTTQAFISQADDEDDDDDEYEDEDSDEVEVTLNAKTPPSQPIPSAPAEILH